MGEERFLSAQADAFAGANAEEKRRPAPFEMTGWRGGSQERMRKKKVGLRRSIPKNHPGCQLRK
jgi:hypothetical protein